MSGDTEYEGEFWRFYGIPGEEEIPPFVNVNSIANNVNGFASNESGTRRQYAWASPRAAAASSASASVQVAAAGAPSSASQPGKLWQLEPGDEGYYSYEPKRNQYGHETTLNVIRDVAAKWAQTHPENPFGVGDISVEQGGPMTGHPSGHKMGLEVDIRLMRNDGNLKGTNWHNPEYSRAR